MQRRVIELSKDSLQHLSALADERNVDLQTLADEAFADLLKKHGRI